MLPTPSTAHVNYDHIYEPSEDSYLILDTLSSETETQFLHSRFGTSSSPPLVLEVGSGSGVVLAFITAHAGQLFGRSDVMTAGLDINSFACTATIQTVEIATRQAVSGRKRPGVFLDASVGDLTGCVRDGAVDVLVFNPPYVPSQSIPDITTLDDPSQSTFDRDMHLSLLATDGGLNGMQTTNRLLEDLPRILSSRGVAYVLLCAQNKPDRVMASIREWSSKRDMTWHAEKVGSSGKKAGWEKLCIIRIWPAGE